MSDKMKSKKAIVVGAGIVGLTTSCRLAEAGYEVTLVEQGTEPGAGSSMANAGQLLYDYIGAMGSPGFLRSLPNVVLNPDQGVVISGLARPSHWPWAAAFVKQCTSKAWRTNTRNLIEIAQRSRTSMAGFNRRHAMEYDWKKPGKIIIYQTTEEFAAASEAAKYKEQFGGEFQVLSKTECLDYEPALKGATRKIAGGIFMPNAELGNCYDYCKGLADILVQKLGGRIDYGVKAIKIEQRDGKATALHTANGTITGDIFVVTAGMASPSLLTNSFVGKQPIIGIKGISLTYEMGDQPPGMSVTDAVGKFVMLRLGDKIRIAGYAIFSDNLDIDDKHVTRLKDKAKGLMPHAANWDISPEIWTGFRPQTPNDCPMIGRAGAENIYVNAGHGSMGWMLAFGSAEILLEQI